MVKNGLYALMEWTGKGVLVVFQPTAATNTIIPHVNWLDLFERSVGS